MRIEIKRLAGEVAALALLWVALYGLALLAWAISEGGTP